MAALITATVGDGKTLEKFAELLAARAKYLNESAKDSVAACAIDALRSIRAVTAKATNASVVKNVEVKQDGVLYPSMKSVGGAKIICIRTKGGTEYKGPEEIVVASDHAKLTTCFVFRFADWHNGKAGKTYLIIAQNAAAALKRAKEIKRRRAMRYSGLARTALTRLMMKTSTVRDGERADAAVTRKADEATRKIDQTSGKTYSVRIEDNLGYAVGAVKGGQAGIDTALKKAMNKIAATINQKCKNLLLFKPLEAPFPEVRQRR